MLVSKNGKICVTPNANGKILVTPNANPQRGQVEYFACSWTPGRGRPYFFSNKALEGLLYFISPL